MQRARLTPVDVVFFAVAFLLLSVFTPMIYTVLNDHAGSLGTGSGYIMQMIVPALIVTLLSLVVLTGASGGTR